MSETTLSVEAAAPGRFSEDWLAVLIGPGIFALAFSRWSVLMRSAGSRPPPSGPIPRRARSRLESLCGLGGGIALVLTYLALLMVLSAGASALGEDVRRFALRLHRGLCDRLCELVCRRLGPVGCGDAGHQGGVRPRMVDEAHQRGRVHCRVDCRPHVANFFPRFAEWLKAAIRPELYIKIAIVLLGAFIAVTAAGKLNLALSLLLRGVAAIVEAYLIYWPVVYLIARKGFGFSREWSAPLASGISSAASRRRSRRAERSARARRFRSSYRRWW